MFIIALYCVSLIDSKESLHVLGPDADPSDIHSIISRVNHSQSIVSNTGMIVSDGIPDVLMRSLAAESSNQLRQNQSMVMNSWIYCQSPKIPIRAKRAAWWFFTLEHCVRDELVSNLGMN